MIPRELIDDAGTSRIFDAVKYVSGVSESTLPGAIDRITLRGFQTDNGLIDNFNFGLQANMDPIVIDRVEVVKGPSSILTPTGGRRHDQPSFQKPAVSAREFGEASTGAI